MANIYINYNFEDVEVVEDISENLLSNGHAIIRTDSRMKMAKRWDESIAEVLSKVDIIIVIWSTNCVQNNFSIYELQYLKGYAYEKGDTTLFIPVVFDKVSLPNELAGFLYLTADRKQLHIIENQILNSIEEFLGRRDAIFRIRKEELDKIEKTAADYIEDTISELSAKEKLLIKKANRWFYSGYISLITGILLAIAIGIYGIINYDKFSSSYFPFFIAIKTFIVIGLLILLSKYSLSLGKTFMDESLINANRIHAISFGRFYLRAYGQQSKKEEIKEIFQHWNIDKPSISDNGINGYDPKLLESLIEILKTIRKIK